MSASASLTREASDHTVGSNNSVIDSSFAAYCSIALPLNLPHKQESSEEPLHVEQIVRGLGLDDVDEADDEAFYTEFEADMNADYIDENKDDANDEIMACSKWVGT